MKRLILLTLLVSLSPTVSMAQKFQPGCTLRGQIKGLKQTHPIDDTCPIQGQGGDDSKAQNRAKNNFCASNVPVEVTIPELKALDAKTQTALTQAGIPFGSPSSIPPNRDRLRQGFTGTSLKEGMAVFIRAFVLEAHHSNVGSGESVNCKVGRQENNDIHISLGLKPESAHCDGINAEISPHFRPTTWNDFGDYQFTHPVMIMGQLFYDASHKPCRPGKKVRPARISSWEIHPVYSIFVCKNSTLEACPPKPLAANWVRFDKWVELPGDEDPPSHHAKAPRRAGMFWAIKEILHYRAPQVHIPQELTRIRHESPRALY